ncbi:tetratricopeptide repeat protein [Desulfovibrio inopinatus]|uniref:tetratricopeptide repeat protein n=1 Tax=Desulfovibrio inopinatus TaxID=102109 RepID=UPI00041137CF|nr:tetratricopeptide repeat protein [Desulfovibrio inopinatus]
MDVQGVNALKLLGYAYATNGKVEEAIMVHEALEALPALDPTIDRELEVYAARRLAWLYVKSGRYADAVPKAQFFLQRADNDSDRAMSWLALAHAYRALGQDPEADDAVKRFLSLRGRG